MPIELEKHCSGMIVTALYKHTRRNILSILHLGVLRRSVASCGVLRRIVSYEFLLREFCLFQFSLFPGLWATVCKTVRPMLSYRLCLGAYRTCPSSSFCVLANEPPLYIWRRKLSIQYCLKLSSSPQILHITRCLITGSIARSANLPVFSLLRGRF